MHLVKGAFNFLSCGTAGEQEIHQIENLINSPADTWERTGVEVLLVANYLPLIFVRRTKLLLLLIARGLQGCECTESEKGQKYHD
jgi:hypothetical protein